MKARLAAAILISSILLLSSSAISADVPDPGIPQYANRMLHDFVTPTVEPGQTAWVGFNFTNPYPSDSPALVNFTLTIEVYVYATQEDSEPVTSSFPNPPLIEGTSTKVTTDVERVVPKPSVNEIPPKSYVNYSIPIVVSKNTPHGSYFSQATYFIRLQLRFNFEGNETPVVLKSRGWFTEEEWDGIVSWDSGEDLVNRSYLRELGADGLIPDTSFGVKVPIPRWPLAAMIVLAAGFCFVGAYYYVLDNPGKYPKLEKRFYYLRGKLSELRSEVKHRRSK